LTDEGDVKMEDEEEAEARFSGDEDGVEVKGEVDEEGMRKDAIAMLRAKVGGLT